MSATVSAAHSAHLPYIPQQARGYHDDIPASLERPARDHIMDRDSVSLLQGLGTTLRFDRNQTVFSDGDSANFSYGVVSGAVRLCKLLSDGRRQIADFCLPNDYFGFAWADEYALTAEAVSDVVLVRYPRRHIENIEQVSSNLREHLTALLHRNLSSAQNHILMPGRQTVRERVASFLLLMLRRQGHEGNNGDRLDLPMGRQDIADYLGLTIETVYRALSDLKRASIIVEPTTREIVVENAAVLRAIASGKA